MVFGFFENALNLSISTHAPVSHSKLQEEFFENLFPQNKWVGKNYDLFLSKFNQKISR